MGFSRLLFSWLNLSKSGYILKESCIQIQKIFTSLIYPKLWVIFPSKFQNFFNYGWAPVWNLFNSVWNVKSFFFSSHDTLFAYKSIWNFFASLLKFFHFESIQEQKWNPNINFLYLKCDPKPYRELFTKSFIDDKKKRSFFSYDFLCF